MELKRKLGEAVYYRAGLLIVPYGIETPVGFQRFRRCKQLLIVPYGIETAILRSFGVTRGWLLIVPYGIETSFPERILFVILLLIVPYGIETWLKSTLFAPLMAF